MFRPSIGTGAVKFNLGRHSEPRGRADSADRPVQLIGGSASCRRTGPTKPPPSRLTRLDQQRQPRHQWPARALYLIRPRCRRRPEHQERPHPGHLQPQRLCEDQRRVDLLQGLFGSNQTVIPFDAGFLARSPRGWNVNANANWGVDANWFLGQPNGGRGRGHFGPKITARGR